MSSEKHIERQVGIFVFIGIVITCIMIIYFGKVGDRFRSGIPITVEFSNAGGLVPGAQVLYSGVLVGKVGQVRLNPEGSGVDVEVNLFQEARVRKDAHFMIKQSGLLGDQNLVVIPVSTTAAMLTSGDRIRGVDPFDFSDVANQAGDAIRKLNAALEKISSEFVQEETIASFKRGINNLADLSEKLKSNSDSLNDILGNVKEGKGTIGKLVTDEALFDELKRLIHNWRVYGLLYREKATEKYPNSRRSGYPGETQKESP